MIAAELDAAYARLGRGLAAAGEAATPLVLARLTLLLMQEIGDAQRVNAAIEAALALEQPER